MIPARWRHDTNVARRVFFFRKVPCRFLRDRKNYLHGALALGVFLSIPKRRAQNFILEIVTTVFRCRSKCLFRCPRMSVKYAQR